MEKFAFIILNYRCMEETISCIEAIQKLSYKEKYIIVVDNASDNQEEFVRCLKAKFAVENNITFLKSTSNLGYARGNNIGIDYARKQLNADYVCVVNPDLEIQSEDFIEKSIALYKEYDYAVLGPRIIDHGRDINPLPNYSESIKKRLRAIYMNYRIYFTKKWNLKRFNFWKKRVVKPSASTMDSTEKCVADISQQQETYFLKANENFQLSGACLIFSPKFFQEFSGYCKDTFLYCEEFILSCVCHHTGYGLLYSSDLITTHGGSLSVKKVEPDSVKRQMYVALIGSRSDFVVLRILLHKNNLRYLRRCLNPDVDNYDLA